MKTAFKLGLLGVLILAAGISLNAALGSMLRVGRTVKEPSYAAFEYEPSCGVEDAAYIVRGRDGYVCVFAPGETAEPVSVTGIELSSLRRADLAVLEEGIAVADREELLSLLEDLGS